MLHDQTLSTPPPISTNNNTNSNITEHEIPELRDIHALTPPSSSRGRRHESWEAGSHHSTPSEQFTTMSREFNAMVVAGSNLENNNENNGLGNNSNPNENYNLARIGEEDLIETNPLAIVPDTNPIASPPSVERESIRGELEVVEAGVTVGRVKKEETETKISAWQTAEIAKVNNRFKRDEVVINGWENEQVEKATAWLKKIERKLDEQRAKAMEKTQNNLARAHRKAEEKRASAEAKRGVKVAKILELSNFMRAVGRVPSKRSFF